MNPKFFSIIAVLLVVGGSFYFWEKMPKSDSAFRGTNMEQVVKNPKEDALEEQNQIFSDGYVEVNNFDECIAAGNKPLAEAEDKCLTKDGHVFIQGVEE